MNPIEFSIKDRYLALINKWPTMIALAAAGALVGLVFSYLLPTRYFARASVMIDHNTEQVLPEASLKEIIAYLDLETLALEDIAYSDQVWDRVRDSLVDEGISDLPEMNAELFKNVRLPHALAGEWSFVALSKDARVARSIAKGWAQEFMEVVSIAISESKLRDAERIQLEMQAQLMTEREAGCASLRELASQVGKLLLVLSSTNGDAPDPDAVSPKLFGLIGAANFEVTDFISPDEVLTVESLRNSSQSLREAVLVQLAVCESTANELRMKWESHVADSNNLRPAASGVSPSLEIGIVQEGVLESQKLVDTGWLIAIGASIGMTFASLRIWLRGDQR